MKKIYLLLYILILASSLPLSTWAESGLFLDMKTLAATLQAKQGLTNAATQTLIQPSFLTDNTGPIVTKLLINEEDFLSNDFAVNPLKIKYLIVETDSGLATWNMALINVATVSTINSCSGYGNLVSGSAIPVTYNVAASLASGSYKLILTISDGDNNLTTHTSTLNISENLEIKNLLNGPNPFNPNQTLTHIQYQLTEAAEVTVYIYSISGERLYECRYNSGDTGGRAGFNSITWNGRNEWDEIVANGPYIVYLTAQNGQEKQTRKTKILVLK